MRKDKQASGGRGRWGGSGILQFGHDLSVGYISIQLTADRVGLSSEECIWMRDVWGSPAGLSDMSRAITGPMCLSTGNWLPRRGCAQLFPLGPPQQCTSPCLHVAPDLLRLSCMDRIQALWLSGFLLPLVLTEYSSFCQAVFSGSYSNSATFWQLLPHLSLSA